MATRLSVFLAREAPRAAILRRGPSNQVCLIDWDLRRDRFQVGQWFRGRVYEHKCDLSPAGDKLLYFAADYRRPMQTWTAVSRVPYFTALLLWPAGDTWGRGGLYLSENRIALHQAKSITELAPGFVLPRGVKIEELGDLSGRGLFEPIEEERLMRLGWKLEVQGAAHGNPLAEIESVSFDVPHVYCRRAPEAPWTLTRALVAMFVRNGPVAAIEFALRSDAGEEHALGRLDWADWSPRGDLLFAREGRLFRTKVGKRGPGEPQMLADFSGMKFEAKPPPPEALRW